MSQAAENARAKGIREALQIWQAACQYVDQTGDRARVTGYLAARGLDVKSFRGGTLPPGLVYLPECPAEATPAGPAMIAAFTDDRNRITGVHRTLLDREKDAKRDEALGPAKMMRGACAGRALRLWTGDYPQGVLVLCEGIETGLAVHQATGLTVWPVGSIEGYRKLMLPARLFWPVEAKGKGVHTVIFAADLNKPDPYKERGLSMPTAKATEAMAGLHEEFPWLDLAAREWWVQVGVGEREAWRAGMRMMAAWPWVTCVMQRPGIMCAGLIEKRGEWVYPARKSVDWLDVLAALGPAAVGSVLGGVDLKANADRHAERFSRADAESRAIAHERGRPVPQPGKGLGTRAAGLGADLGDGGGEAAGHAAAGGDSDQPWIANRTRRAERPILEADPLARARRWLWTQCRVEGQRRFGIARWGGEWWLYREGAYAKIDDEQLRSVLWNWMSQFAMVKASGKTEKLVDVMPTARIVEEVMRALAVDTAVHGVVRMPAQLPPVLRDDGSPMWGEASKFGAKADSESAWAKSRIVFRNGVLDLGTLKAGARVELQPHSCEIFTGTALPFDLPVEELQELVDHGASGDAADAIFVKRCPKFYGWLADASEQDPEWEAQLQEMLGDTISQDRSIEKVYLVVGAKRAGKGILEDAIAAICGEDNVASTSFSSLTADRFGLYPLLGKSVAVMPEAHLGNWDEGAQAVEVLKAISGQGRVQVRDLYQSARTVKLSCRVWIFCNEEPDLRDDSTAMANRLIVLPMRRSALGREDAAIKASVPREAAGIMLWALCGAIRLHGKARRAIEVCGSGLEVAHDFERDSAPLKAFLDDRCVLGDGNVLCGDLYDAYELYCERDADRKPMGEPKFFRKIKYLVPGYTVTQPRDGAGRRKRVANGVALRSDAVDELRRARNQSEGWASPPFAT